MALKGCSNFQWHIRDELHFSVAYRKFTPQFSTPIQHGALVVGASAGVGGRRWRASCTEVLTAVNGGKF